MDKIAQWVLGCILAIILVAAGWFGLEIYRFSQYMNTWEFSDVISEVEVGNGRTILVEGQRYHDEGQKLRYSVRDYGSNIVHNADLGYSWGGITTASFNVLSANQGDLVVLTETNAPRLIVILHDFTSGYSFPRDSKGFDNDSKFDELAAIIRNKYPEMRILRYGDHKIEDDIGDPKICPGLRGDQTCES